MVVKMSSPGALVENRLNGLGVSMSVELINVLIAVLAIGATLAGLILTGNRGLRQDMARLESRLGLSKLPLDSPFPGIASVYFP